MLTANVDRKTSQMMTNRVRFKLSLSCLTQNNIGLEVLELLRPFSRVSLLNIFKEPVGERENSSNRKVFVLDSIRFYFLHKNFNDS